jgi:hypothetical protein
VFHFQKLVHFNNDAASFASAHEVECVVDSFKSESVRDEVVNVERVSAAKEARNV